MKEGVSPILQAALGTLFTWGLTAAGSALVFVFSGAQVFTHKLSAFNYNSYLTDIMSLLIPEIRDSMEFNQHENINVNFCKF